MLRFQRFPMRNFGAWAYLNIPCQVSIHQWAIRWLQCFLSVALMNSREVAPRILLIFLVIGCWLRVWGISSNSLWFDEAFTHNVVVYNSIANIARSQILMDLHPPFYFVLLAAWTRLVGDSEVSLRMLSAF